MDFDDKDIRKFESDLLAAAKRAIPYATRSTLNSTAFDARRVSQKLIRNKMVQRNQWTVRSVQVEMARGSDIAQQEASVGSTAEYLERQEFGYTERKRGKHGVVIPTSAAAGQKGAKRTRLVRRPNRLPMIKLGAKGEGREGIFSAIAKAVKTKKRVVFIKFSARRGGIFRVMGGRQLKSGRVKGAKLRMLHDVSRPSVKIPRLPWLDPAVVFVTPNMRDHYRKSLQYQLDRLGLLL